MFFNEHGEMSHLNFLKTIAFENALIGVKIENIQLAI